MTDDIRRTYASSRPELMHAQSSPSGASEHTVEPSAQGERERFEALLRAFGDAVEAVYVSNGGWSGPAYYAVLAAYDLATTPSPRIQRSEDAHE